jgi:DNA-binding Lrp family transcriptional regulator
VELASRLELASRAEPASELASQRRRAGLRSARGREAATIAPQPGHRLPASAPGTRRGGMVTAIVLIKCDVARIPETAEAIAQITEVSEVYSVTGEFDLVAMVRVRQHEELGNVIPGQVNRVAGVTHTETHIAFRAYSRHDLDAAFSLGYPESS